MSSGRILLVDDDPSLRGYAERYLGRMGFQVEGCATAEQGWAVLGKAKDGFLLAIVDLSLPGDDGFQFGRRLRHSYPALPVLYWSGLPADREALRNGHADRVDFLPKPFSPRQLAETVNRLVTPPASG